MSRIIEYYPNNHDGIADKGPDNMNYRTDQAKPKTQTKLPGLIYVAPFLINFYAPFATYRPHVMVKLDAEALRAAQQSSLIGFENDPTLLIIRGTAYLLALFLVIKRFPTSILPSIRQPWFAAIVLYVLLSMSWSAIPAKVFINFGHIGGMGLIALNLHYYFRERLSEFFFFIAKILSPIILLSLLLILIHPTYGVSIPDLPTERGRWYGITDNANNLGLFSLISIWANLAAWKTRKKKSQRLWIVFFALLAFITLAGSGSSTSITLGLFTIALTPFLLGMEKNNSSIRLVKLFFAGMVCLMLLATTILVAPERLEAAGFFALFGRSATLSGRTHLWEQALRLIEMRPWLGWSFDSNATVLLRGKGYLGAISAGQFHNGYLDLMVRGGRIGLILALAMTLGTFRGIAGLLKFDFRTAMCFLALTLVILLHNITEASLINETNMLWSLFVFTYFAVGNSAKPEETKI